MNEIPDCPEFMEFMKWFEEQAWPEYKKFYTHASTCPQCQQTFMEFIRRMELKMMQTPDDEFIEEMKRL